MKEMRINTNLATFLVIFSLITGFSIQAQIPASAKSTKTVLNTNRTASEPQISYDFNSTDWYYISYTKQPDGFGAIFVNGDSIGKLSWEALAYDYSIINIASTYSASDGFFGFFEGTIDEIRLSNKVRTASELKTYFDSDQPFPKDASTLQIWRFDEGSGDTFENVDHDMTGKVYGTLSWVDGKFGKAIKYDGIKDRSRVTYNLPEYGITYEFWVKFDAGVKEDKQAIIQTYGTFSTDFEVYGTPESVVDPELNMEERSLAQHEVSTFPVIVTDFLDILSAQYTISWDPSVIKYLGVQDFGLSDPEASSFVLSEAGKLSFSWDPPDSKTESVDDNTVIFNMIFEAVGAPGQFTDVAFTDDPTLREISDGKGNILDANYINGKITIREEMVLGGYIKTQSDEPLVNVEVELTGDIDQKTTTDEFGWYSFSTVANKEYRISPIFDLETGNGVSTLDIVIMHWHILGEKDMLSNYDRIAGDVNGDKFLTARDLAAMRAVVLGNVDKFSYDNKVERNAVEFINKDYTGADGIFAYKNYLDIIPTESHPDLNFTAVKLGDAGNNWQVNMSGGREQKLDEVEIILEKGQVTGNSVYIPLKVQDFTNIVGLQFTLQWDPEVYRFEKLSDQNIEFISNLKFVDDGLLTVTWNSVDIEGLTLTDNAIISNLEFTSIEDNPDSKIEITSELTPALAFNSELQSFHVKSRGVEDKLTESNVTIYPNPANDFIHISGIDPKFMSYSILSTTGNVVLSSGSAGKNEIDIENLNTGIYIFQISNGQNGVINRKFIKQ